MDRIEIKLSKKKIYVLLLGGIVFVFFSIWFIINPLRFVNIITRSEKLIFIAGCSGLIFFGIVSILLFIKLFDKMPGLILNIDGIEDNSSYSSVGLIKWSDITKITQMKIASTSFLLIEVKNPETYLKNVSFFKRFLLKQNLTAYGTPITLTSSALECNLDELEKILDRELKLNNKVAKF